MEDEVWPVKPTIVMKTLDGGVGVEPLYGVWEVEEQFKVWLRDVVETERQSEGGGLKAPYFTDVKSSVCFYFPQVNLPIDWVTDLPAWMKEEMRGIINLLFLTEEQDREFRAWLEKQSEDILRTGTLTVAMTLDTWEGNFYFQVFPDYNDSLRHTDIIALALDGELTEY